MLLEAKKEVSGCMLSKSVAILQAPERENSPGQVLFLLDSVTICCKYLSWLLIQVRVSLTHIGLNSTSIMTMKKALDHCGTTPHNRARPGLSNDSDIIHPCEKTVVNYNMTNTNLLHAQLLF
jgi:hypothetical protein